jgi:Ca-activated chloride channel family protein
VVLAVDVSSSMGATDTAPAAPTRLDAAKATARDVVDRLPEAVRVGVVAFSSSGLVTQQPTDDRGSVLAALDRLRPGGGSALAEGLRTALASVVGRAVPDPGRAGPPGIDPPGPDLGYHGSAAVVLLSDGENTDAPDPVAVAELASSAGVRVHPVGLGRPEGTVLAVDGFSLATALDEPLLRAIAERTDGAYVAAADAGALPAVARALELQWTVRTERIEVTALLAAAAGLLLLGGVALSLARTGRIL